MNWSYLFTSFDGRIGRLSFWSGFLPLLTAEIGAMLLAQNLEGDRLGAIVDLAFAYPEFALLTKRSQDRGNAPWVVAAYLALAVLLDFLTIIGLSGGSDEPSMLFRLVAVPWIVVALGLLIDLGFRRGTTGPNRFGPDPLEAGVRQ